jgi:hypothetical protein
MIASLANDPDKSQVALVRLSSVFESATPVKADPVGRC